MLGGCWTAGFRGGPVQAQRMRTRIMHHFAAALQDADVIFTPTAPIVAPELQ